MRGFCAPRPTLDSRVSGRRPLGGGVRFHQSLQRTETNMTRIKSALERRLAERQEGRGLLAHRAPRRRHHHRHPGRDRDPDLHRRSELGEGLGRQVGPDQRQDRGHRVRHGQPDCYHDPEPRRASPRTATPAPARTCRSISFATVNPKTQLLHPDAPRRRRGR